MLRPEDDKTVVDQKAVRLKDLVKPSGAPEGSELVQPATPQVIIGDKEPPKVRVYRGSEPVKEITVGE